MSNDDGVVELADDIDDEIENDLNSVNSGKKFINVVIPPASSTAPFLSQGGEILPETKTVNLNDPKQTRVILYIVLSLVPVLFLIPLMLGNRDLLPLDAMDGGMPSM